MSASPVFIQRDFLPPDTADALLAYALASEALFKPTKVGLQEHERDDPKNRISLGTRDLGPFKEILKQSVTDRAAAMLAALSMTPITIARHELELIAHGDGAFYGRHVDLNPNRHAETIRALSGVYYFHARPKAFTGGALRLYPSAMGSTDRFVDVEPDHNSLAVFPSFVTHEVMPVHCPSHRFEDSRFSVNCWVHVLRKPR